MEGHSGGSGSRRPGTLAGLGPLPMPHGVFQTGAPSKFPFPERESSVGGRLEMREWRPAVTPPPLAPSPAPPPGSLWSRGMWAPPCPPTTSHLSSTWAGAATTATGQT
uniref:Inositol polyphosphate-5-phosphatase J n=1 Tax=Pipistrellus kuhlii TaxID=59472 RepID=A0A7J7UG93_PIPKU|nr:inositol polyphosphate-5-phosphatase J [Pipistrellus kuhlii]